MGSSHRLPISDNDKNIIYSLFKVVIDQNPHLSYIQKGDASLDSKIRPDKKLGNKGEDIGLPIGSLTSQFSSLIYLNELDYFVKNELKYEKYIRYVDDMVFFNKNSRDFYEVSNNVNLYLEKELKLELNPKKTKIQQFEKGLDFLGYVIYPHHIKIRKRNIINFKNKLLYVNLWLKGEKTKARNIILPDTTDVWKMSPSNNHEFYSFIFYMSQVINSYYGNFIVANTYNLRKKLYEENFDILKNLYYPVDSFAKFKIKPINKIFDSFVEQTA